MLTNLPRPYPLLRPHHTRRTGTKGAKATLLRTRPVVVTQVRGAGRSPTLPLQFSVAPPPLPLFYGHVHMSWTSWVEVIGGDPRVLGTSITSKTLGSLFHLHVEDHATGRASTTCHWTSRGERDRGLTSVGVERGPDTLDRRVTKGGVEWGEVSWVTGVDGLRERFGSREVALSGTES